MDELLTAVVATFNEAQDLAGCLQQLSFCDDVLVVDLGSSDDCVEIAKEYGARAVEHPWVPFAEKVRSFALEHVGSRWIIFVDPDMYIPSELGIALRSMLERFTPTGLGMVYLPILTYFGDRPLLLGQKGGRRAYLGVIHRDRVQLSDQLHHQGVQLKEGYFALCLSPIAAGISIRHYWIETIKDAFKKAKRYLPYEPQRRHAEGQSFSWHGLLSELIWSLRLDLHHRAYLDRRAAQIMVFQLWYILKANLALLREERRASTSIGSGSE